MYSAMRLRNSAGRRLVPRHQLAFAASSRRAQRVRSVSGLQSAPVWLAQRWSWRRDSILTSACFSDSQIVTVFTHALDDTGSDRADFFRRKCTFRRAHCQAELNALALFRKGSPRVFTQELNGQ